MAPPAHTRRGAVTTATPPTQHGHPLTTNHCHHTTHSHRGPAAVSGRQVLTFRARAQVRLAPPTCRTPPGQSAGPPDSSQSPGLALVSTPLKFVTTRHQRFALARLPDPHLTRSSPRLFPQRSPRTALNRRSLRWFGASPCRATPEDLPPSPAQHRFQKLLHRRLLQRS